MLNSNILFTVHCAFNLIHVVSTKFQIFHLLDLAINPVSFNILLFVEISYSNYATYTFSNKSYPNLTPMFTSLLRNEFWSDFQKWPGFGKLVFWILWAKCQIMKLVEN